MKLTLDHTQRLNLHALMGAQRANVDEVRLWWRLQDQIELSEEERRQINYRVAKVGEIDQPIWDVSKALLARTFEFTTDEFKKIEGILKAWQPGFLTGGDRRWLEPLLSQFDPSSKEVNGAFTEAPIPARYSA